MTPIVVDPEKSATLPELMTQLASERLLYVGETHTAYADHLLQLEVLRGMAEKPEGLAMGVEWFQA
ncbi:MAG: ChaN family lipoprotein, partial [Sedimenticolaceae bacterium]